ncbi:hypothetical protein ACFWVU_30650 [Streptomyces sp. NPDC058686]|uniref:hypothetical protein n=1 Tax=Streptomyces sp. NPDC058686 TaxID=3346599 RepID=UPI00364EFBD6
MGPDATLTWLPEPVIAAGGCAPPDTALLPLSASTVLFTALAEVALDLRRRLDAGLTELEDGAGARELEDGAGPGELEGEASTAAVRS